MADRAAIDATVAAYYDAWTRHDVDLYRTLWTEDATFADPPADDEQPATGVEEIAAAMDGVWELASAITYDREMTWRCGHVVASQVRVTMDTDTGVLAVPLIHVFRLASDARIARMEAYLDLETVEVVEGTAPDWVGD